MLANAKSEQTLIGIALENAECAEALAQLPEEAFTEEETRVLFRIIREMVLEHKTPNMVSVGQRVTGNAAYVKHIMECGEVCMKYVISASMYKQIETEVVDLYRRRELRKVCMDVSAKIADPSEDVDASAARIAAAVNDNPLKEQSRNISDVVEEFLEDMDSESGMISTGIAGLDRLTGGIQNGNLVILGARPKVGKTALGLSIALHVAKKAGPVLINSLEMTPKEIMARIIAAASGVSMTRIVRKNLKEQDHLDMSNRYQAIASLPIRFAHLTTPLRVRQEAFRMQRNNGLSMIMIDYLQLMSPNGKTNGRYEAVSEISRELKLLAIDLDVPILALTQFNRGSEQGGVRRKPSMSEARDSGSIEQDANMFLIQYPPTKPNEASEMYEYWAACEQDGTEFQMLEVAANRQGQTGTVMLKFDKAHMRFITMTKEEQS